MDELRSKVDALVDRADYQELETLLHREWGDPARRLIITEGIERLCEGGFLAQLIISSAEPEI